MEPFLKLTTFRDRNEDDGVAYVSPYAIATFEGRYYPYSNGGVHGTYIQTSAGNSLLVEESPQDILDALRVLYEGVRVLDVRRVVDLKDDAAEALCDASVAYAQANEAVAGIEDVLHLATCRVEAYEAARAEAEAAVDLFMEEVE